MFFLFYCNQLTLKLRIPSWLIIIVQLNNNKFFKFKKSSVEFKLQLYNWPLIGPVLLLTFQFASIENDTLSLTYTTHLSIATCIHVNTGSKQEIKKLT